MKKQIFSLMVGTFLLTSNTLFAMTSPEDDSEHRISVSSKPSNLKTLDIHECASCNEKLRFTDTDIDKIHGKGDLNNLLEEVILIPFKHYAINDLISSSMTSKYMYNFCQNPLFWTSIAERENLKVDTQSCIKEQVKNDHIKYLSLFKKAGRDKLLYSMSIDQLTKCIKNPCTRTWLPQDAYKDYHHTQSYQFTIGKRKFELFAWHPAVASSSYPPSSTVHQRLVSAISEPPLTSNPREKMAHYESFFFEPGSDGAKREGFLLSIGGCSLSIMELGQEQL